MDRTVLQRKREQHAERTIRLDPALIERVGLLKNKTHLKIDDYYINCVPYEISLAHCNVVSVLGPREITFFTAYSGTAHNLYLAFDSPIHGREISLYAKARVGTLRQPNPESSVCLIDLEFVTVPNDLAEIIVTLVDDLDRARSAYDAPAPPVPLGAVYPRWSFRMAELRRDGTTITPCARIVTLASNRIELFLDAENGPPGSDTVVDVVLGRESDARFLKGTVDTAVPSEEVPGCVRVSINLEFEASYVEQLLSVLPATRESDETNQETEDTGA